MGKKKIIIIAVAALAVIGAVVAGPIGLAAGALGKKRFVYVCNKCNYQIMQ